ncbi:hypothetical protein SAMN02745857_02810 [Andreprevotia lacus DSM 23236]|jgi:hypothetical protein|uniref:Cytochrome oxidase complex assembly protein 1 n=1 Tax=Andreprevotia lacus DSM 23236 TaxID=1121001 RepID=A0A1W1XTM7_9NEIS|nr:hypothetical protein [Andreprevotia lacus]SMC27313.1 hypothetical protein SAMN02745857_02810 [Andreprevotia lacus DSM 23236]
MMRKFLKWLCAATLLGMIIIGVSYVGVRHTDAYRCAEQFALHAPEVRNTLGAPEGLRLISFSAETMNGRGKGEFAFQLEHAERTIRLNVLIKAEDGVWHVEKALADDKVLFQEGVRSPGA